MYKPTLSELEAIKTEYKIVPVSKEIFADLTTPIKVLKILKNISDNVYLFESVENTHHWGRYSFLGFNPSLEISCKNHLLKIKKASSNEIQEIKTDNPNIEIREILKAYKSPKFEYLPSFTGGLVGYFAYEYLRYQESKLDFVDETVNKDEVSFNDVDLMLFDKVIAFDHYTKKIILIVNIKTDNLKANYAKAIEDLEKLAKLVIYGKEKEIPSGKLLSDFKREFTKDEYIDVVKKTQHYIKEGDIFQAVISNRIEADFSGSLLNAYRILRTINPSPYMFYLSSKQIELTGASPETLIKLEDKELKTFPIAGTMPRGKDGREDDLLKTRLLSDEKELAENLGIGEMTLHDIIEELEKPGRDPRSEMPKPVLRTDVLEMKDLKEGWVLKGTVRNVIDFGAFVDIGVHQDGLVHISQMTDRYIKHPLEVVSVGDIIDVQVMSVDLNKKRIQLTMKIDHNK